MSLDGVYMDAQQELLDKQLCSGDSTAVGCRLTQFPDFRVLLC